ncbi:MAG: SPOR domain-containing protein [Paludibacteraceae bacterium]|nr:SPOR domain-containing protein [Paludibacteraceae bacterium]
MTHRLLIIRSFALVALLSVIFAGHAQQTVRTNTADSLSYPKILTDMHNVRIVQDPAITQLMQAKITGINQEEKEGTGWRVQVYSSNVPVQSKQEAQALETKLKDAVSQPVYILSTPPFIKVRIGDFRTQEEAQAFKAELIALFPELVGDTYIVRDDHIKIR